MDCKSCKEYREVISRQSHEADMDRMERANKRLFWALIVAILIIAASWAGFIWYESQWEVVETTEVVQEADGSGNNSYIGGNYYGSANSQDYTAQDP